MRAYAPVGSGGSYVGADETYVGGKVSNWKDGKTLPKKLSLRGSTVTVKPAPSTCGTTSIPKPSEGYFAILKRGVTGIYHSMSEQHLKRYLYEFDFRDTNRSARGVKTWNAQTGQTAPWSGRGASASLMRRLISEGRQERCASYNQRR